MRDLNRNELAYVSGAGGCGGSRKHSTKKHSTQKHSTKKHSTKKHSTHRGSGCR